MLKRLIIFSIILLNLSVSVAQSKLDPNLRLAKTSLSRFKQNKEDFKSLNVCLNHLENAAADTANKSNHVYWTTKAEALALISELWISCRLYGKGDSTHIPKIDQAAFQANYCLITAMKCSNSESSYHNIANQLQVNIINLYNEGLYNMNTGKARLSYDNFKAIAELGDSFDRQEIALYPQNEHLRKSSFLMAALSLDVENENPEYCLLLARSFDYQMQSEDLYKSLCYCKSISSDSLITLRLEAIKSYPALEIHYQKALIEAYWNEQKTDEFSLQLVGDYIQSQPEDFEAFLISGLLYGIKSQKSSDAGHDAESKKYFELAQQHLQIALDHEVGGASAALGTFFFQAIENKVEFIEEDLAMQLSKAHLQAAEIENPNERIVLQNLYNLSQREGNQKLMAEFANRLYNLENGISNVSYYRR